MTRNYREEIEYEASKVFYLSNNEIVELEMPILMDLSQLMYGKLKVITKSNYPVSQFVNVDVTVVRTRFSLVGKILSVKIMGEALYEVEIILEALPNGMITELKESRAIVSI